MNIQLRRCLFILPNLFTLCSLSCGFYAIVLCGGGGGDDALYRASLLIIFAMFFDMIDGRVARMTRTQSAFGMQIDSLADVVSFGVAPALLVYVWSLSPLGELGMFVSFAYLACGTMRLARFNVLATSATGRPRKPGKYILGLPIPGAAGILVSLVAANHAVSAQLAMARIPIVLVVLALSFFMVSTVRFRSFKDLQLSWGTVATVALAVSAGVVLAIELHVAFALGFMLTAYVAIGLVETLLDLSRRGYAWLSRVRAEDPAKLG